MDEVDMLPELGKPSVPNIKIPTQTPPSPRTAAQTQQTPRSKTSTPRTPKFATNVPTPVSLTPRLNPKITFKDLTPEQLLRIRFGTVPQRIVRPIKEPVIKLNFKKWIPPQEEVVKEESSVETFIDIGQDTLTEEEILRRMGFYGNVRLCPWKLNVGMVTDPPDYSIDVRHVESQCEVEDEDSVSNVNLKEQIESMAMYLKVLTDQLKDEQMRHAREINFMEERYDALLKQLMMKVETAESSTNTYNPVKEAGMNTKQKHYAGTSTDTDDLVILRNQRIGTDIITRDSEANTNRVLLRDSISSTEGLIMKRDSWTMYDEPYVPPPEPNPTISPSPPHRGHYSQFLPRSPRPAPLLNKAPVHLSPVTPAILLSPKIRPSTPPNRYQEPGRDTTPSESAEITFVSPRKDYDEFPVRDTSPSKTLSQSFVEFAEILAPFRDSKTKTKKTKTVKKTKKKVKSKEEKEKIEKQKKQNPEPEPDTRHQDGVYFLYVDAKTKITI
jgi:hypothetical protein